MLAGLTGNFGTGKSTVLALFKKAGAVTIDSDGIVGELYGDEAIKSETSELLGNVFDQKGDIDRKKVADIIFADATLKRRLEKLLHGRVFGKIMNSARAYPHRVVVAEIPLLFETGYDKNVDVVILTRCDKDIVFSRLEKKGYTGPEIRKRLSHQMPDNVKIKKADFVINTAGAVDEIERQVNDIYNALVERIEKKGPRNNAR